MDDEYTLSAAAVARHWAVRADTVRRHARDGSLKGFNAAGTWTFRWRDVWRAEGRVPSSKCKRTMAERSVRLLDKAGAARRLGCKPRSVERYQADDLPSLVLPSGHRRYVPAEVDLWRAQRDEARRRKRHAAAAATADRTGSPSDPGTSSTPV